LSGCFPVGLGGTGGVEVEGFNVSPVRQG
jgi:hypothetical protein